MKESDRRLASIESKIDKMSEAVNEIQVQVAKNTVILDEHQRRSVANEKGVEQLKKVVLGMFCFMVVLLGDKAMIVAKFFLSLPF